jgi:hypothetical protein
MFCFKIKNGQQKFRCTRLVTGRWGNVTFLRIISGAVIKQGPSGFRQKPGSWPQMLKESAFWAEKGQFAYLLHRF